METQEDRDFACTVLGGIADITITNHYVHIDLDHHPILRSSEFAGCANKLQCGIAKHSGNTRTYLWECCPAHPAYDPGKILPGGSQ